MTLTEWTRTYAGLCINDEGGYWSLSWFGRTIDRGTEEQMAQAYTYFCERLADSFQHHLPRLSKSQ